MNDDMFQMWLVYLHVFHTKLSKKDFNIFPSVQSYCIFPVKYSDFNAKKY